MKAWDCALGALTGAKNLFRVPDICHSNGRIRFGKLRPTSEWRFLCPHKSMAPVLAIAGMVAGPSQPRRFDPVGEIFQPFVTGPNRIPFCM